MRHLTDDDFDALVARLQVFVLEQLTHIQQKQQQLEEHMSALDDAVARLQVSADTIVTKLEGVAVPQATVDAINAVSDKLDAANPPA